ncbi:hypothetical protein CSA_021117 [Cucumis sativus]|uniref:Uncharacterized protein n=2 Tax=Cucumis sativus TaxID=3659 RepID=A0A0A0LBD6_CUCSA|nr:hypothetical protein CSA_021117 [Cucumis sativus]
MGYLNNVFYSLAIVDKYHCHTPGTNFDNYLHAPNFDDQSCVSDGNFGDQLLWSISGSKNHSNDNSSI